MLVGRSLPRAHIRIAWTGTCSQCRLVAGGVTTPPATRNRRTTASGLNGRTSGKPSPTGRPDSSPKIRRRSLDQDACVGFEHRHHPRSLHTDPRGHLPRGGHLGQRVRRQRHRAHARRSPPRDGRRGPQSRHARDPRGHRPGLRGRTRPVRERDGGCARFLAQPESHRCGGRPGGACDGGRQWHDDGRRRDPAPGSAGRPNDGCRPDLGLGGNPGGCPDVHAVRYGDRPAEAQPGVARRSRASGRMEADNHDHRCRQTVQLSERRRDLAGDCPCGVQLRRPDGECRRGRRSDEGLCDGGQRRGAIQRHVVGHAGHPRARLDRAGNPDVRRPRHAGGVRPAVAEVDPHQRVPVHANDPATWTTARKGFLEEVFLHEAAHAVLDETHARADAWRAAQAADGVFISEYAGNNPVREISPRLPSCTSRCDIGRRA